MPKAYWIVTADLLDQAKYDDYRKANAEPLRKYGARFITRAGKQEIVEGKGRSRSTVIEFPSFAAAKDCYNSPEYQHAKTVRQGAVAIDIVIVEGYDGPQP